MSRIPLNTPHLPVGDFGDQQRPATQGEAEHRTVYFSSNAGAAGVDPTRVRAALSGGCADSRILQVHGKRMRDGDFRPGGKVVTQRKDLHQALELTDELGLKLPATRLNLDLYERLVASGGGELDHSALIKVIAGADDS